MKVLFLLSMLTLIVHGKQYRFDYEWSEEADGWLKYHATPATWDEARLRCYAEGAVLASPLTSQLRSAIITFVNKQRNTASSHVFIGVHATFSKGDFSSVEGVPLSRLSITWAQGEPDNFDNSESCLGMFTSSEGQMFDTRCTYVLPYVCYKKQTQLDMTECGTTDPAYNLERKTGSCYKVHETGLVWSQAYKVCAGEGGYLAVINNNEEGEVIRNIFNKYPERNIMQSSHKNSLLVGFHDWGKRGVNFMTIHGESLASNYHNWGNGEPNNGTNDRTGDLGQYCGSVTRGGELDDFYCNAPAPFICEKSPDSLLTLPIPV